MTEHVNDQNWLAIAIDFLIVVLGVFIGVQLGNWNETRQERAALADAEIRFAAEVAANFEMTDTYISNIERALPVVRRSIEHLQTCSSGEGARSEIEIGANRIRGTLTLRLRDTALNAITGNNEFVSLLTEERREQLKSFQRELQEKQATLDWLEQRPFERHIEESEFIEFGDLSPLPGLDDVMIRPLEISAPIDQLCESREFKQAFFLWERTATFQALRARQLRGELERLKN